MAAILNKAMSDLAIPSYEPDARWFAGTDYCEELCNELGVDYEAYLGAMRRTR